MLNKFLVWLKKNYISIEFQSKWITLQTIMKRKYSQSKKKKIIVNVSWLYSQSS